MRFAALALGVIGLNLFAIVTIRLRPKLFSVSVYKPMLSNFKLSVLPLAILLANIAVFVLLSLLSAYTQAGIILTAAYVLFFIGLLIWLLFLPNAGYLITELNLSHRQDDDKDVPIWYDVVSILAFALSGIANTMLNIIIIQTSFLVVFDPPRLTTGDYATLFAGGFAIILVIVIGIYFGRAMRLNTWDILRPRVFLANIKSHFSADGVMKEFALYVAINTIFFVIMYVTLGIPFYFMNR